MPSRLLRFRIYALICLATLLGCRNDSPENRLDSADQDGDSPVVNLGQIEVEDAIALGDLRLIEYPPRPSPPGHGEYVALLREQCGVTYEVASLPRGAEEAEFRETVDHWNEVMRREIRRKFGDDVFERLRTEADKKWRDES